MNKAAIINDALDRLREHTGIRGNWIFFDGESGVELDLLFDHDKERVFAEVKKELRNFHLPGLFEKAKHHQPFMVIAERIFPTLKEMLRERNIGYLDGAGNIFIKTPLHYVWLDGKKSLEPDKPKTNRAFTKAGLRMVFYLLLHPEAVNAPYRHFHTATGIAIGNIKNIMDGLKDGGFIINLNKREVALQNKRQLLERWIVGYQETLKATLYMGAFRFVSPEQSYNWQYLPLNDKSAWGGEAGADILTNYLSPQELTLYTAEKRSELIARLKLIPDPKGDIKVYEKFWYNVQGNQMNHVPPLLVYADLMITGEPRCLDVAQMIYDKYLRNEFE